MNNSLNAEIMDVSALSLEERQAMYGLMDTHYERMNWDVFLRDLAAKDICILLRDTEENIQGFSTQVVLTLEVEGKPVRGVFSGDTIIHRAHWGSMALFQVFARHYIGLGAQYPEFYWFLISKGIMTYGLLPLFFREFYPGRRGETPPYAKAVMDAFGRSRYPQEYCPETGVIEYHSPKDALKEEVVAMGSHRAKNPDAVFFSQANPGWAQGNDLVCLASLQKPNLRTGVEGLLGL